MNKKLKYLSLTTISTILLSGCGGGSATPVSSTTIDGQIIDSYISNVTYTCGDITTVTDTNGTFSCNELPVTFKVGNVVLGTINTMPSDGHIFPQDLLSLDRTSLSDNNLIKMAQFLQTLDSNDNPSDGITIENSTIDLLQVDDYLNFDGSDVNKTLVDSTTAINHLQESVNLIENVSTLSLPTNIEDLIYTPKSTLDPDTIHTLEYMGDEETLAYDLYNKLYELYSFKQFKNIAQNSEINHIKSVQALIRKYEIIGNDLYDKEVSELTPGTYAITEIQDLYDNLYAKGIQTKQDALEVGCMVEVTDVDDLDKYITTAQNSNADDIVTIYEYLRKGSYNHYWAFDTGLKNLGVSDGCCSLGNEYCKTIQEYPKSNNN